MTYKADPVHDAADKIAELTGVPRLQRMAEANKKMHRTRRQIILPSIAITGSAIAFVATLNSFRIIGAIGALFFVLAMLAQRFGPIRLRNAAVPYDECEQLLIWRARSIGMGAALLLSIIGCAVFFLDASLDALGFDGPFKMQTRTAFGGLELKSHQAAVAMAAMWLLATTATGMTTISASFLLPKEMVDEDVD